MQIHGSVPVNMAVDEVTVSESSGIHDFSHSLGKVPNVVMLLPKERTQSTGASALGLAEIGFDVGNAGAEYKYRLIHNFINASNNWDYTTSNMGWKATQTTVSVQIYNSTRLPVGKYYLITYAYEE